MIDVVDGDELTFSENLACPEHGVSFLSSSRASSPSTRPTAPARAAQGSGPQLEIDPDLLVPDTSISINEGALVPWTIQEPELLRLGHRGDRRALRDLARHALAGPSAGGAGPIPLGTGGDRIFVVYRNRMGRKRQYTMAFEGLVTNLQRRYKETDSSQQRDRIEEYMSFRPCPGAAARAQARGARREDRRRLDSPVHADVGDAALRFVDELELTKTEELIGGAS